MDYSSAIELSKYLFPCYEKEDSFFDEITRTRLQEALLLKAGFQKSGFSHTNFQFQKMQLRLLEEPEDSFLSDKNMQFRDGHIFCGYLINAEDYDDVANQFGGFPDLYPFYLASQVLWEFLGDNVGDDDLESACAHVWEESTYNGSPVEPCEIQYLAKAISNVSSTCDVMVNWMSATKSTVKDYLMSVAAAYAELFSLPISSVYENLSIFSQAIVNIGECLGRTNQETYQPLYVYCNKELGKFLTYDAQKKNPSTELVLALKRLAKVLERPVSYYYDNSVSGIQDDTYFRFTLGEDFEDRIYNPSLCLAKQCWDTLYPIWEKEVTAHGC